MEKEGTAGSQVLGLLSSFLAPIWRSIQVGQPAAIEEVIKGHALCPG
jgi:hypothetical protein